MSARVHVVQSKKVGYNHVSIRAGVCVARMPADGQMPFRRNKSVRTGARRRRVETIFQVRSILATLLNTRPAKAQVPPTLTGQVLGMNASGRLTAPPQYEVVLVTSRARAPEAFLRDSDLFRSTPLRLLRSFRGRVCHPLASDFAAPSFRIPPPVRPVEYAV
jgi:hypothetical protein